jgi:hypothetical protein
MIHLPFADPDIEYSPADVAWLKACEEVVNWQYAHALLIARLGPGEQDEGE